MNEMKLEKKLITTEDILQKVGSFGLYQKLFMIIATYSLLCWGPFYSITFFLIAEPRWECAQNSTVCNITGLVGPGEANYGYRCGLARHEWKFVDAYTSLVTQFDLVCAKSTYGKHINTISYVGYSIGALLGGIASDRFGRKKVVYLSGLLFSGALLLMSFSSTFTMAAILVFFVGISHSSVLSTEYVWVVEYVGMKYRSLMANGVLLCYGLGYMILPGVGYLVREWRMFTVIISLSSAPVFTLYCLTPESIRWMIVTKRSKAAVNTLKRIAKVNKKVLDDVELPTIENEASSGDIRMMFSSGYAKSTVVLWYAWFVNALVYDSVHLSAPTVGGNMYLNWCLSGISELVSTFFCIYAHNRFGRKKCIIVCEVMAALSALGAMILTIYDDGSTGYMVGKILMSMVLAKFFITISYDALYLLTAEYYPTIIRNVAHGTSVTSSAIGGVVAGYVTHLIRVHPLLPYGIMGVNTLISAILCLTLKETNNQPILEVLQPQEKQKEEELDI